MALAMRVLLRSLMVGNKRCDPFDGFDVYDTCGPVDLYDPCDAAEMRESSIGSVIRFAGQEGHREEKGESCAEGNGCKIGARRMGVKFVAERSCGAV